MARVTPQLLRCEIDVFACVQFVRRVRQKLKSGKRAPLAGVRTAFDGKGQKPQASPREAAKALREHTGLRPTLAIVLGSGFHHVPQKVAGGEQIPYAAVPGFLPTGVSGHSGEVVFGKLAGTPVVILSGRSHFYEGHEMTAVTFAVRTLAAFGVTDLLLTNAAGGINGTFHAGDFMVISDHINLMGTNPLRGTSQPNLTRFVDLSAAYDSGLSKLLHRAATKVGRTLRSGVYLAVTGPSYETPAEIRAFRALGADAVGMSTVPETIVARQCNMRVAGLSCITNMAAGISREPLSHHEVLETAERVKHVAAEILTNFAAMYAA